MKVGYIFLMILSLIFGAARADSADLPAVLMIGSPCGCLAGVSAEVCDAQLELDQLLAEREYRWIILCLGEEAPMEEYQDIIGKLLRTQPQARTVIQSTDVKLQRLATAHQMEWGSCCEIIEMLREDGQ